MGVSNLYKLVKETNKRLTDMTGDPAPALSYHRTYTNAEYVMYGDNQLYCSNQGNSTDHKEELFNAIAVLHKEITDLMMAVQE